MSTLYSRDEIISTSNLQKSCKNILDALAKQKKKKFALSRNSNIEAVITSADYFEELEKLSEKLKELEEHVEIAQIIAKRAPEKGGISLSEIAKKYGL